MNLQYSKPAYVENRVRSSSLQVDQSIRLSFAKSLVNCIDSGHLTHELIFLGLPVKLFLFLVMVFLAF